MAYNHFAYWYDAFNTEADYDALVRCLVDTLKAHGIAGGLVADLGCGTGEVSLRLAEAGYELIGVDASAEMLSVFQNKLMLAGREDVLLLCQKLENLDLFGTLKAAVSTFDTLNHLSPDALRAAIERIALFLEPDGLFIFDVNTPYKHEHILGNRCFEFAAEGDERLCCRWENRYRPESGTVDVKVEGSLDGQKLFSECFCEYAYPPQQLKALLSSAGLHAVSMQDGEDFGPARPDSPRLLFAAVKNARKP